MNVLLFAVLWLLLAAISLPLAILLLVLVPAVWLIALPFRLAATVIEALFALLRAVLFLPARLLGERARPRA